MGKKVGFGLGLVLAFSILGLCLWAANPNDIDKKIQESKAAQKKIEEQFKQVDQMRKANEKAQTSIEKELDVLEGDLRDRDVKIKALNLQISDTQAAIMQKEKELDAATAEVNTQNDSMKKRLRTMYKSGNLGYLQVLLGSEDFSDLLTRADKVQLLLDYDQDMLKRLQEARKTVETAKLELEEKRANLASYKGNVEAERKQLKNSFVQYDAKKGELAQNHKALLNQLNELKEDADRVTKLINNLVLEKRKYVGGKMLWPVPLSYTRISSPFGNRKHPILGEMIMHTGIDIPAPNGTAVYAAQGGKVVYSGWLGSYGQMVMIDHGGSIITVYAHNSALNVASGDTVAKGDKIAAVGSTGRSTGNHLHFEVRVKGNYINPLEYVKNK